MNDVKVPMDKQAYSSRKRDSYNPSIPGSKSTDFGAVSVTVERSSRPRQDSNQPSGNPRQDGMAADFPKGKGPLQPGNQMYREVIPPGEIGSEEFYDMQMPPPNYVDTVARYTDEEKDPSLHDPMKALKSADTTCQFVEYAEFQPRTAPMPRAAQDEGFLQPYSQLAADPLMTDLDSFKMLIPRDARRWDLYGENVKGVLHNDGKQHPGFQAVQSKIAAKQGVSKERAGAMLAASSRGASKAAKKKNPRLNKVKG